MFQSIDCCCRIDLGTHVLLSKTQELKYPHARNFIIMMMSFTKFNCTAPVPALTLAPAGAPAPVLGFVPILALALAPALAGVKYTQCRQALMR